MAKTLQADATTLSQLLNAASDSARRSIVDSRLGSGTLTFTVYDGSRASVLTGEFSGADLTADGNAMVAVALSGESGSGGTPSANWAARIANSGGAWIELPQSAWNFVGPGGSTAINSSDEMFVSLSYVGGVAAYVPSTPPAAVTTWIANPYSAIQVPSDFLGIHSDYVAGATYPVQPTFMSSFGCVRSLDHDPDRGWTTRLSWALMEPDANGSYVWTHMDKWVAEHSGKLLIYVIDRCPAGYAKYTTAYNLYPSLPNSSSPPSDWTKAANLCSAIRARYPAENFLFELWNEPNFGWADGAGGAITAGNMYTTRMTDAFVAWAGISGPFFIGTATDLAEGARILKAAGIPLIVGAWEGQTSDWLGNSFRRLATCPTTGGGTGKDHIDYWSFHSYTYNGDGRKLLAEGQAYKALAATLGLSGKPFMLTEIGHESPQRAFSLSDEAHSTNVIRWAYIAAALGCQKIVFYNLDSAAPSGGSAEALFLKFYSDPNTAPKVAANAALATAFQIADDICGKTIGQAAQLSDGSIWIEFTDNTSVRR